MAASNVQRFERPPIPAGVVPRLVSLGVRDGEPIAWLDYGEKFNGLPHTRGFAADVANPEFAKLSAEERHDVAEFAHDPAAWHAKQDPEWLVIPIRTNRTPEKGTARHRGQA